MTNRFALVLAATVSLFPLTAYAAEEATNVDEVVVTANKREELLREVPQSVTVLPEETLERIQANNFTDYVGRIPGMSVTGGQPGRERLTLRGLDTAGVASTVATYVDETPFGSSTGLANGGVLAIDLDPFDIQRIEVLRGPQGTLYGASSLGGLIKFVTVDPSSEGFEARVQASGEMTEDGDESYGVRGLVNVPLGDTAAIRVSAWHRSQGGFLDDPSRGVENVDGVDITGVRAKLIFRPTENLTLRLSAMSQDIESEAPSQVDYFPVPMTPVAGPLDQQRLFSEFNDVTYRVFNGTADWNLGFANLTVSSSYTELDESIFTDSSVAFGLASYIDNDLTQDKFTQEVRLASPDSDHFEWLVGLYYAHENGNLFQQVFIGAPPGPFSGLDVGLKSEYEERAVFANATWYFSPEFDVSAGVRYSANEQTAIQSGTAAPSGTQSSEDSVTTYSFSPRWRMSEDTMIYGRIASGYRPGGPNVMSAFGTIPSTFGPDTALNYELGIKTDVVDGLLQLDLAVFHIEWDDIQLLISDGVVAGNANGGTASSTGVEWTATLTPAEGLTVLWAGAYTDAHLTSDTDPVGGPILTGGVDGDRLPNAARWMSSIDVDYEWTIGDANAFVGGSWRYTGERKGEFSPTLLAVFGQAQADLPSNNVFDLRAGVEFDRFTVELYAKNVSNEDAPLTFGGFGQTPPGLTPNGSSAVMRPRTVGLSVSAHF